jgi:Arc/MetJ family transcription regulator
VNRALAIVVVVMFAVIMFVVIRRQGKSDPEPSPTTVVKTTALVTDDEIVAYAQRELISSGSSDAVKECGTTLVGAEFEGQLVFKTLASSIAVSSITLEARAGDAGVLATPTQLECVKKSLASRTVPTGPRALKIPDGREYEVAFSLTLPPVKMGYGN